MFNRECRLCGGRIINHCCQDCGLKPDRNEGAFREIDGVWQRRQKNSRTTIEEYETDHKVKREEVQQPVPYKTTQQKLGDTNFGRNKKVGGEQTTYKSAKIESVKTQPEHPAGHTYHADRMTKQQGKAAFRQKKARKSWAGIIILLIIIGSNIVPDIFYKIKQSVKVFEQQPQDIQDIEVEDIGVGRYDMCQYELPAIGDVYRVTLGSGKYVVGADIPEGTYFIEKISGEGNFTWTDQENSIYEWEEFSEQQWNEGIMPIIGIEDLRFYKGAVLEIDVGLTLVIRSDNAQLSDTTDPLPNEQL